MSNSHCLLTRSQLCNWIHAHYFIFVSNVAKEVRLELFSMEIVYSFSFPSAWDERANNLLFDHFSSPTKAGYSEVSYFKFF